MKYILATTLMVFSLLATAQEFAGIYQPTDADLNYVKHTSWDAFLADHAQQNAKGYRIVDLESSWNNGTRTYHGIYTESSLPDAIKKADNWTEFIKIKRQMVNEGYTMIDVASVALNEIDYEFYGIWVKNEPEIVHKVWLLNVDDITKHTKKMARDRFKIKKVHVLPVPNGEPRFVVLYHFSPVNRYNFLYFTEDYAAFEKEIQERKDSKVELIDYARYRQGDQTRYLGVFQDGEYESAFLPSIGRGELDMKTDSIQRASGLKLMNLSVN